MKYLETIIGSGLFSRISKLEYILVYEELAVTGKEFKKGSIIFHEDEVLDKLCIVKNGSVRGEKMYVEGDVHILHIWEKFQIFGMEATVSKTKTSILDYISHQDCEVVFISWESIRTSRYAKVLMETLLQEMANDDIKNIHKVNILAHRGLRDKIMTYLSIRQKKHPEKEGFKVNMNREQMAQFLCVNRSALSNELNKMKKEGIIDFERGVFKILK